MSIEEGEQRILRNGKQRGRNTVNSPVRMEPERRGLGISKIQRRSIELETIDVSEGDPLWQETTTKPRKKKPEEIRRRARFVHWINTENSLLGLCLIIFTAIALSQASYPGSLQDQFASSTSSNPIRSEAPFADHVVQDLMKVTEQWTTVIDPSGQSEALTYALRAAVSNLNGVVYAKLPMDFPSPREYHRKLFNFTSHVGSATADFQHFDRLRMAAFRDVSLGLDKYYWALFEVESAIKLNQRSLWRSFDGTADHEALQTAHGATLPFIDHMLVKLNTTLLPPAEAVTSTFRVLQRDLSKIQRLCDKYAQGIKKPNEACRWTPSILRGDKKHKEYELKAEWFKKQTAAFHAFENVRSLPGSIVAQAITQYKGMDRDLRTLRRQLVELGALNTFDATTVIRTIKQTESIMTRFKVAKNEAIVKSMQIIQQMSKIDNARIMVET